MTLLQQSTTLREKLEKVEATGKSDQVIRVWQPLREVLPEHLARLERLVTVLRLLHDGKLLPAGRQLLPNEVNSLLKDLPELRDKLLNRPDKVMQKSSWAKADIALKAAAIALEQTLDGIWKTHLQDIAPKLDDWQHLFQVDRFGEELGKIRTLREELQLLARSLPSNEEVLARAEAKSREIHRLVKKLDFGDIPPEVKKFMEQVANFGGASLSELNETVFTWLRERELFKAFRVSMGGQ